MPARLLAALLLLGPCLAAAEETLAPGELRGIIDDAGKLKESHARSRQALARAVLGDPWSDATREREYTGGAALSTTHKVREFVLYETPIPIAQGLEPLLDSFPDDAAAHIASGCRKDPSQWWLAVACVSAGVHEYYRGRFDGAFLKSYDGLRAACRSHAVAFNKSFDALGLPRSLSKTMGASGTLSFPHVANQFMVTGPTGVVYSYVVDSTIFPGVLHPENDAAVRFHDRDGDGRSDFFEFPEAGVRPDYTLRAK